MSHPTLTTLLVANRGEIACRVMRTAKAMGLTTVAVHSAIDRDALHTREADIRVDLGAARLPRAISISLSCWQQPKPAAPRRSTQATAFCRRTPALPEPSSRPG